MGESCKITENEKKSEIYYLFFFILIFFAGSYYGLKLYIYNKINNSLPSKIRFSNLKLSVSPFGLNIKDIKNFPIKNKNILSFRSINLHIPFLSIFSKTKKVNIDINEPKMVLNPDLFKENGTSQSSIKINKINIKNGELIYNSSKLSITLLKFNLKSVYISNNILHIIKSPHLKIIFPISKKSVTLEGDLSCEIKQEKDNIKINKFSWNTEDLKIKVNGRIFKDKRIFINTNILGNPENILYPLLKKLAINGFVYGNAKISKNKEGTLSIHGKFNSPVFYSEGEQFSDLRGDLKWDNINKNVKINSSFISNFLRTNLKIDSTTKNTRIFVENMAASKLAKMLKFYDDVPLGSIVEKGDVLINKGNISGKANLKNTKNETNDFNLKGEVKIKFDSKNKTIRFYSNKIHSEFGELSINGQTTPSKKQLLIEVKSKINETGNLHKYSKFFINVNLDTWKLRKGNGKLDLVYNKTGKKYSYNININFNNFYSSNQKIDCLKGNVKNIKNSVYGTFFIDDSKLKLKSELLIHKKTTSINFKEIEGESKKIFKILSIEIPLHGNIKGNANYNIKKRDLLPIIKGNFESSKLIFLDQKFSKINGNFLSNLDYIQLENLKYYLKEGKGETNLFIDFIKRKFKTNGEIKNLNINKIKKDFYGKGEIFFEGEGHFFKEPIKIKYKLNDMYFYKGKVFNIIGEANLLTDFADFKIESKGNILNKKNQSKFDIELNRKNNKYTGKFNLNLLDINLLIPWENNNGEMNLNGQIFTQDNGKTDTRGIANFKGKILSIPKFSHAFNNFQAFISFNNISNFTLQSFRGEMGKGKVECNGYMLLENSKLKDLILNFSGRKMTLYPMNGTTTNLNADLTLKYNNKKLLLQGELDFLSGIWKREIDDPISFYTNPNLSTTESKIMKMLEFDLKLVAKDNMWMINSIGKIKCKFNLRLKGSNEFPILTGLIESKEGKIYFSDKKFNLIKAKAIFNNELFIDPLIRVESEAFIKDFRIKFNIHGPSTHLKPKLQSSPPLPTQDILSLISLGELFKRPTTTELSSHVGTLSSQPGTTSLITSKLNESIQKSAKKFLGIDLLKINPTITGSSFEGTSRLIVGKSISDKLLVVYSTNISSSKQEEIKKEVIYLQYQISPSISLIGMRNEERRFSIDIRFRKKD